MATTAAIMSILVAVVPFLIWLYKRRVAKQEDPVIQQKKQDEKLDKAIADNDVDTINEFIHDKLQDQSRGDSSRPSN